MIAPHDYLYPDDHSERVDPRRAADELIAYATWVADHVRRETGRRVPGEAAELLSVLTEKNQGLDEVYKDFQRFRPRRAWVDATKQKMARELFLNEIELERFESYLEG